MAERKPLTDTQKAVAKVRQAAARKIVADHQNEYNEVFTKMLADAGLPAPTRTRMSPQEKAAKLVQQALALDPTAALDALEASDQQ